LGVSIFLPPLSKTNRTELERRMWNPSFMTDYLQIKASPLEPLHSSEIRFYKNGKELGLAFKDIYFGKYYPAVSSYMGGKVTFNFGPDFKYTPPEGASPYCFAQKITLMPRDSTVPIKASDKTLNKEIIQEMVNMDMQVDTPVEKDKGNIYV
jgi:hypothetical protein